MIFDFPVLIFGTSLIQALRLRVGLDEKCSFQKESIVCGRRIGIRKGSGDIVYDPRPGDPIVQFKLPGKQAREE